MKAKLYITIFMLFISISSIAQQRSYCEITPLHLGKYPIYGIAKHTNKELSPMFAPDSVSYIEVKPTELSIVVNSKTMHKFKYLSVPRSGIDYLMWDDKAEVEVPVYILYIKNEETKDKYFGIFIKYDEDIEWAFTYKAGTQIKEEDTKNIPH